MSQYAHGAGHLGDLVDIDVKASRRHYGAERADPRRRPSQARWGHDSVKKPHGKASETEEIRSLRDDILSVRTMIGKFIVVGTRNTVSIREVHMFQLLMFLFAIAIYLVCCMLVQCTCSTP